MTNNETIKPCTCGFTRPEVSEKYFTASEVQVYCPKCDRQTHFADHAGVIYDWNNDDDSIMPGHT